MLFDWLITGLVRCPPTQRRRCGMKHAVKTSETPMLDGEEQVAVRAG
jgi:hypothetical protein